jgi:hypothetical protein
MAYEVECAGHVGSRIECQRPRRPAIESPLNRERSCEERPTYKAPRQFAIAPIPRQRRRGWWRGLFSAEPQIANRFIDSADLEPLAVKFDARALGRKIHKYSQDTVDAAQRLLDSPAGVLSGDRAQRDQVMADARVDLGAGGMRELFDLFAGD